jgi:hypothetical protein
MFFVLISRVFGRKTGDDGPVPPGTSGTLEGERP